MSVKSCTAEKGAQDKSGEGVMVQREDQSFWLEPHLINCEGYRQEFKKQASHREVCSVMGAQLGGEVSVGAV